VQFGQDCQNSEECCSNLVCLETTGKCGCLANGEPCTAPGNCCSGVCTSGECVPFTP
jgi:hypothetical protein